MVSQTRKETQMKPQRPNAPSICARCLCFYVCELQQVTDQCPVTHPPKPADKPFDHEFGRRADEQLDKHLESLVQDDFPLELFGNDGVEKGGGTE